MPPSALAEIKRLEDLINQAIGATRGLSDKFQKLSENMATMEAHRVHEREAASKTDEQIEKLTTAINSLNATFANINGRAQGVSMVVKAFWAITGTIITASILWLSTTLVDLKTQVAVLQSREKPR